ncbi:MAG: TOBE domain-containing protein [Wenzhouxiangella sp.]|jgi:molybdate transport system regulatory protein|nr:TOBE domain-containing protein [Wenzhouxiangella sp.]
MLEPEIDGRFWLNIDGHSFAGSGRINLLEQVQATGSISAAARAMGMSYKAAWDAIDAMNNLAEEPLLVRQAGGRHGGGTQLTAHGEQVIRQFRQVELAHQRFLQELARSAGELGDTWSLMRRLSMNTSARNQLLGSVRELRRGAVNDEVVIDITQDLQVKCSITRESSEALALQQTGRRVHVLIKAPFVMLAAPSSDAHYSTSNRFPGVVKAVVKGAVQSEVQVDIGHNRTLTAMVACEIAEQPWLRVGEPVEALVNPAHIILATSA